MRFILWIQISTENFPQTSTLTTEIKFMYLRIQKKVLLPQTKKTITNLLNACWSMPLTEYLWHPHLTAHAVPGAKSFQTIISSSLIAWELQQISKNMQWGHFCLKMKMKHLVLHFWFRLWINSEYSVIWVDNNIIPWHLGHITVN